MQFTKIRYDGSNVELTWEEADGEETRTTKLFSTDPPKKPFQEALNAFLPNVLELLELSEQYGQDMSVRSVSVQHKRGGSEGLVVSCVKSLPETNAPFVLHTPYLLLLEDEADSVVASMDEALSDLRQQAQRYLDGDRAQGNLFQDQETA